MDTDHPESKPEVIKVPATGGWPMVAAFGLSLAWAGMLTHWMVSALGGVCLVTALVGWFREVLPQEAHEAVPVGAEPEAAVTARTEVRHLRVGEGGHRARLPLKVYPYAAGLRGGIADGIAMVLLALLNGILCHRSIWYPINLLAASASSSIAAMDYQQLRAFSLLGLVLSIVIHSLGSLLVGLLYGIALPMFPRRPILFGGVLAPLAWSGLLYSVMGIVDPTLQARVDWLWFVLAQIAIGLVAGVVVAIHERVFTMQYVPFAERLGFEAAWLEEEKSSEDSPS